jgi:hypothetical protein
MTCQEWALVAICFMIGIPAVGLILLAALISLIASSDD